MNRISAADYKAQHAKAGNASANMPALGARMSAKDFLHKVQSGELVAKAFGKGGGAEGAQAAAVAQTVKPAMQPAPASQAPASQAPAKPRKKQPEFEQQCALFEWARHPAVLNQYPCLKLLSASLNGVKLSKAQAGKAKAAGMLQGESDVRLPVARGNWIGLIIEMKAGDNKATPEQLQYGTDMQLEGHRFHICYSWQAAQAIILEYVQLPKPALIAKLA